MSDPFETWANDDLLASPGAAEAFAARYDKLAEIFHWSNLVALFEESNGDAARLRRRSRDYGLIAVGIGVTGLVLAALTPVAAAAVDVAAAAIVTTILGVLAALFAIASAAMAYSQFLMGRDKSDWLLSRFKSERLRQFHFQLILNRLNEIVLALRSDAAMTAYLAAREDDLTAFRYEQLENAEERMLHLANDTAEDRPWIFREWAKEPPLAEEDAPELKALLDVLAQQRFGVQHRFVTLKLKPGMASPATRSALIARASNVLTALLLLVTIVTGASLAFGATPTGPLLVGLAATTGIASAAIAAMRVISDGLQLTADTERYRWYLATIKSLNRRFDASPPAQAVARLRDLERLSYQEMRRFIVSASQSKFVI